MVKNPNSTIKNLTELASQLIRFKTIDGNWREQEACLHFIAKYFADVPGLHFNQYQQNDYHSLVITNQDTHRPSILLSGHIDVVDGSPEQFKPYTENGKLFGRGALDMKAGVAALMSVFSDAVASRENIPSLGLMITSDEEKGGRHGVKYLVDEKGWRGDFVVVAEGQSKSSIATRQKGKLWLKMISKGKAAHGAYPWLGENAVEKLIVAYRKIRALFPEPEHKWIPTVNLASISSDATEVNKVPAYAEATLDIRFTNDFADSPEEILERLKKLVPDMEFEVIGAGPVMQTADGNGHLRHLQKIFRAHRGAEAELGFTNGGSDAGYFTRHNVPAVEFGPQGANHHGENEYVELDSLTTYSETIRDFIRTAPR